MKDAPENTRISGKEIYTPLANLPERFTYGPHTKAMSEYLSRRWTARSYGWYRRCNSIEFNPECSDSHYRWVEHPGDGLRLVGKVHDIVSDERNSNDSYFDRPLVDHSGWFMDNHGYTSVAGEVYQLPSRRGYGRYVPAIEDADNDGALLDFRAVTSDLRTAIKRADRMAEEFAEEEREYRAKDDAENRMGEIKEEIAELYANFKVLAKEARANCEALTGLTAVKDLIHQEYRRVKASVHKLRAEYRKVEDEGIPY